MNDTKARDGYYLLAFQIVAHAALVWGIFNLTAVEWALTAAVYFIVASLGVSVTYHRLLSHKSWEAPAWWYYVGSLCGFWGLVGSPLAWSNNHIAHHRYTDTANDPHSPNIMPWWKVQWFSMLTTYPKFRFSLSNINAFQTFLHRNYFKLHLVILATLLILFGLTITVAIYLAPAAVVWNMGSLVNTINHSRFGYRNEDTANSAINNHLTGYLVFGEGWHNNHHKYPGRAKFGIKWFELDVSYWCIRLIQKTK
jgi:stearoyl-CoA desaturase (delta-9 desaturase)